MTDADNQRAATQQREDDHVAQEQEKKLQESKSKTMNDFNASRSGREK